MLLPTFDLQELKKGETLQNLDIVCQDLGFFKLTNHGMEEQLLDQVFEEMKIFFNKDLKEKLKLKRDEKNPFGYNDAELTKQIKDWKEIFDMGPLYSDQNQWPKDQDTLRSTMEMYYKKCEQIAKDLISVIFKTLGSNESQIYQLMKEFDQHTSFLRLNYYSKCPNPAPPHTPSDFSPEKWGKMAVNRHTDAGAVTVLLQDGVQGLQIIDKQGHWQTLQCSKYDIVINIGDVIQVWSNNRYIAPLHRVIANSKQERFSSPFFLNPSNDCNYAPLASTLSDNRKPYYKPINWKYFRAQRASGDYADLGTELQISHYKIDYPNI